MSALIDYQGLNGGPPAAHPAASERPDNCVAAANVKITVLCVMDYYLPGFKGGGPIRTLANMVDLLAGYVQFAIVTRDRDLGARLPYDSARVGNWQQIGNGLVYYADPQSFGVRAVAKAGASRHIDVVYLNSFFGFRSSISIYLHHHLSRRKDARLLLAPRGEFSPGALAIKRLRKKSFLGVAKLLCLYRDIWWHASTAREAEDILRLFPFAKGKIYLAADPVSVSPLVDRSGEWPRKVPGELRIAFISRISPMKNLDGLLKILAGIDRRIDLAIYGPLEDEVYWQRCEELVEALPLNVVVRRGDSLEPNDVSATFAQHDLFAFPTLGENFGHVIFESLRAGTPVLISDQTPWQDDPSGAVTVAPLESLGKWRAEIELAADRDNAQQQSVRLAAIEYARRYVMSDQTLRDNLKMFQDLVGRKK